MWKSLDVKCCEVYIYIFLAAVENEMTDKFMWPRNANLYPCSIF